MTLRAKATLNGCIVALVALICVIALAIFVAGHPDRELSERKIAVSPDPDLMPGNTIPERDHCYMLSGSTMLLECSTPSGQSADVQVDPSDRKVEYVAYMDETDFLGDLINAWGRPNGYVCYGKSFTFYWNDRSAYLVSPHGLSNFSVVGFVEYGSPDIDYKPLRLEEKIPSLCDITMR